MLYARQHGGPELMADFTLVLHDVTHIEKIEGVTSFVGEDDSGAFGILANHTQMMTTLLMGLARFRIGEGAWQYIAQAGALLDFRDNVLTISTRHYLRSDDYMKISRDLETKLLAEEEKLHEIKHSLQDMEKEIFKRMWELGRGEA